MPKQPKRELIEDVEYNDHRIEVIGQGDRMELRIDGVRRRFLKREDGFVLLEDAYQPPASSLLEAAKRLVNRQERDVERSNG